MANKIHRYSSYLLKLIDNALSWNDIYIALVNNAKTQNRIDTGKLFEIFCKHYYRTDPSVCLEYKNVWLFSEIPYEIKEKLNLGKIDHGVDLVLEDQSGAFSVVQCKFRSDQNSGLSWSKDDITNLFAEGDRADNFIIFTNASKIDKHSLAKKPGRLKLVTLSDLLEITPFTINQIKKDVVGLPKIKAPIKDPHPHQQSAIEDVINGFKKSDRGQLILPCGAGKTLVSMWIREQLGARHTLVLVPSLALLRQIKKEWSENINRYVPYLCVCSEKDIDTEEDSLVTYIYEVSGSGRVCTNSKEISIFLSNHEETIIYSTYQSFKIICDSVKNSNFVFDLAICDEAHKTSGSKLSNFGLIHLDTNILVKKRLYMTATPRVLSDGLKSELNEGVLNCIYDMSNQFVFGPIFHRMSFKRAIDENILVDYRIVAIGINDEEIQKVIKQRKYTSDNETIDEVANNYALERFMQTHDATHAITFHSSVKKAKEFQARHRRIYPETATYHVNGELPTNERNVFLKEFENSTKSIMTNARCLTEGVDVPAIDVVYFCDPKNSKIDIVQATGRALRKSKHKNKQLGYVLVPIFHNKKESLNDELKTHS